MVGCTRAEAADVTRATGTVHAWTALRATLAGAKLQKISRVGVWRVARRGVDEGGNDSGAALPASVAR